MIGESWLDDIISELEDVETPRLWLWWSLITAISAAAGNNYYLVAFGGKVIYKPNLYVMLLGSSGLGKGFGINLAKLLVQKSNCTRVIAGRSSIQAIVTELSRTQSTSDGRPMMLDSRGFIVNGELSAAIITDVSALAILTDLYDGQYNPEWDNLLKVTGKEKLKEPYITALFGSSQAHFYDTIPQANIEGGYIGRNLISYQEKRYKDLDALSDTEVPDEIPNSVQDYLIPKYVKHLVAISHHKARLVYSNSAKEIYNTWRRKWRSEQPEEKTGFYNRVPDHVLKVSMCLCLARYSSGGIINEFDVQDAIDKVTGLIYSNKLAGGHPSKSNDPVTTHTKTVLNLLIAAKDNQLTRKALLNRGYPYGLADTTTLDKVIDTLIEMGWCERERLIAGKASDWLIKLSGEPLVEYQRFLSQQVNRGVK